VALLAVAMAHPAVKHAQQYHETHKVVKAVEEPEAQESKDSWFGSGLINEIESLSPFASTEATPSETVDSEVQVVQHLVQHQVHAVQHQAHPASHRKPQVASRNLKKEPVQKSKVKMVPTYDQENDDIANQASNFGDLFGTAGSTPTPRFLEEDSPSPANFMDSVTSRFFGTDMAAKIPTPHVAVAPVVPEDKSWLGSVFGGDASEVTNILALKGQTATAYNPTGAASMDMNLPYPTNDLEDDEGY